MSIPDPSSVTSTVGSEPLPDLASAAYAVRWPALFVILAAEVMDLLDALITSIAGPSIVRDLGGGGTLIQWLAAGYTLAMASGLLIGGRLGDIYGRRRMFLLGMTGFTLLSLLCALAPSPGLLVASRVLQGLAGAVMLPQGLGLIKEMFPAEESAKAFGAFGPVMGLSAVAGPILAGWLVTADVFGWGWRSIFAINVPIGAAALLAGARLLPASRPNRSVHVELTSAAVAAGSMLLLIYPLIQGRELGWPAWTIAMVAAGLLGFLLLARIERVRQRDGKVTLITPSLFTKRAFNAGLLTGMMMFGALIGTSLVFTLLVQVGLGYSPLKAGLAGVAQAVFLIVGFAVSQPLNDRLGGRLVIQVGQCLVALGLGLLVLALHWAGNGIGIAAMSPGLGVIGLGMGFSFSPFFDLVLAGVEDQEAGSASGVLTAVQQLGGAFGIAVLGTVLFHAVATSGTSDLLAAFRHGSTVALGVAVAMVAATLALSSLLPARAAHQD